jgi:hypothetical protein
MAKRNYFTTGEIVLCTYAALYDARDFGGVSEIEGITGRSPASIQMKIQNIAAMVDDAGIARSSDVSPLTGLPAGETGRRTNWEIVEPLVRLSRQAFLEHCRKIIASTDGQSQFIQSEWD